jgi:hypothetical protein
VKGEGNRAEDARIYDPYLLQGRAGLGIGRSCKKLDGTAENFVESTRARPDVTAFV